MTMKKRIFSLLVLFSALTATAFAQQKLYLMKGDKTVASYNTDEIDYVTFRRPADAQVQEAFVVTPKGAGKTSLTFRITAQDEEQTYAAAWIPASQVEFMLQYLYGKTIETADTASLQTILRRLVLASSIIITRGSQTFSISNDKAFDDGTLPSIVPGLDYFVTVTDIDSSFTIGKKIYYATMHTAEPEQSKETISVEYNGLTSDGNASFDITPSSGIKKFYALFGNDKSLQQYAGTLGYSGALTAFGYEFTPEEWNAYSEEDRAWEIDGEGDYSLYVLAIDANGDTLMAQATEHIQEENAYGTPTITILSKEAADGNVKVNFEIIPNEVSKATVRLMKENDVSNALNEGKTLIDITNCDEATDITSTINAAGAYTFSQSDIARGWYTLLVCATNDKGSTVMQAGFHSHLTDASWEVNSTAFPNATTRAAKGLNGIKKQKAKAIGIFKSAGNRNTR